MLQRPFKTKRQGRAFSAASSQFWRNASHFSLPESNFQRTWSHEGNSKVEVYRHLEDTVPHCKMSVTQEMFWREFFRLGHHSLPWGRTPGTDSLWATQGGKRYYLDNFHFKNQNTIPISASTVLKCLVVFSFSKFFFLLVYWRFFSTRDSHRSFFLLLLFVCLFVCLY